MSAHPPHSESSDRSIWSILNVFIAIAVAGFALFWSSAFILGSYKNSSEKPESTDAGAAPAAATAEAPAAPAAAAPVAAAAPAPAASNEPAAEITIKPDLANPLAYDTKEFKVKAGQKVKLTFNNTHPAVPQPHNVVIAKPGTKDKLLGLAMAMAAAPDGMAKGFIPDSTDILFKTKLLQPNTNEVIEFTAPAAGDYPYLCTFPGHGMLMNGIMKVE
jgi:azurin